MPIPAILRTFLLVLSTTLLTSACTTIDQHKLPDQDFPTLRIIEHHVDGGKVIDACYKYVPLGWKLLGAVPEGCAEVDFEANTCTIWVRGDYPSKRVLEHERLHCKGYDHPGDDTINKAWLQYKESLL